MSELDLDLDRLDDVAAMAACDPHDMLRAVATSAAQARASLTASREASLRAIAVETRPRAVVVAGMGGSGISGDVLASVAGMRCPVPILVHRGYGLPGWVGAADLVIAVSCSGSTAETMSAASEAARRGARLLGVGATDSPLEVQCLTAHGSFVPVEMELSPRSSLWALAIPLLVVGSRFGLLELGPDEDAPRGRRRPAGVGRRSLRCRTGSRSQPGEGARRRAGWHAADGVGLAVRWVRVAALRAVCQLAENAKLPAIVGRPAGGQPQPGGLLRRSVRGCGR